MVILAVVMIFSGFVMDKTANSGTSHNNTNDPELTNAIAAVPYLVDYQGPPEYMPKALHWCTSEYNSYMINISWKPWTSKVAVGTGTDVTNNGVPNCVQSIRTLHADYPIFLIDPKIEKYYIINSKAAFTLVCTYVSLYDGNLNIFVPPCG